MTRLLLPLQSGDTVVFDGNQMTVVAVDHSISLVDQKGLENRIDQAAAYRACLEGRFKYDNPLIRKLDHGSQKDRKLARQARRPISPRWADQAKRKHWQAIRMEQLRANGNFSKTLRGFEQLATILNAEEAEYFSAGESWARATPDSHAGGLKRTYDIWRRTRSISALGRHSHERNKPELRQRWERWLRKILFVHHLKGGKKLSLVYRTCIEIAIAKFDIRHGLATYPCEQTVRRFRDQTWSKLEQAKIREDATEIERLSIVDKIRENLGLLEVIEIDSTPLIPIQFRENGSTCALIPHVTFAMDVASGVILGRWVSWKSPSWEATRQTLLMAFWPKDEALLRRSPNFWAYGVNRTAVRVVMDRGPENQNRSAQRGLEALKIATLTCRTRVPKGKPHVERLMGHYATGLADQICQTPLFNLWRKRVLPSRDNEKKMLQVIIRRIDHWISDYNGRVQTRLRAAPIEIFERRWAAEVKPLAAEKRVFLGRLVEVHVRREGAFVLRSTLPFFTARELGEILGRASNCKNDKYRPYMGFIEPERPTTAAVFDEDWDGGKGRWIFAKSRDPGAIADHDMQSWYESGEPVRAQRRKKTRAQIHQQYEETQRREIAAPQIEAEIATENAVRDARIAAFDELFVKPEKRAKREPAQEDVAIVRPTNPETLLQPPLPDEAAPVSGLWDHIDLEDE